MSVLSGLTPSRVGKTGSLHAAWRGALMVSFILLSACGDVSVPKQDMPAAGIDPSFSTVVAGYIKSTLKNSASYDALEISDPRWVHSVKGWNWLVCVRFQDNGHRRTYAFFIEEKTIVDSRYAVQSDGCSTQNYSPFNLTTAAIGSAPVGGIVSAPVGGPGPLY